MNARRTQAIRARRGATIVEVAVTAPLAFLLILGLIVGGLGAFRYHQVANLAREGAAYAAVHGPRYHRRTGNPAAASESVRTHAIAPLAAGLNPNALECQCIIDEDAETATVTVRYHWLPETYLPPITLSSTSVMSLDQ